MRGENEGKLSLLLVSLLNTRLLNRAFSDHAVHQNVKPLLVAAHVDVEVQIFPGSPTKNLCQVENHMFKPLLCIYICSSFQHMHVPIFDHVRPKPYTSIAHSTSRLWGILFVAQNINHYNS